MMMWGDGGFQNVDGGMELMILTFCEDYHDAIQQ